MNGILHHLLITLRLNFRSKQAIIYGYVVPIFFLIAFGVVFATKPPLRAEMGQLITVTVLGGACFGMPTAMVAERERGVWRRYRLLPTAIGGIILSAMVVRFIVVLSAAVMQIVLAHYFLTTPWPEHPWQMFGAFTFVCFSFLGLGLVIAMMADSVPSVQALGQAIFLPMIMIGGVGVPLRMLPHWVQRIAAFFPGRYAVGAIEACQHGPGLAAAHFDLLALTVIGLAALLAGARMFRWDIGQRLTTPARAWVAFAVVTWALVGTTAIVTGRLKSETPDEAMIALAPVPPPSTSPAATHPAIEVSAPITVNRITPAIVATAPVIVAAMPAPTPVAPDAEWSRVTQAQIDSIKFDDLPDDSSTTTPFARDLSGVSDEARKTLDGFHDELVDWPPGKVADLPQRIRNFLSICVVTDIAENEHEARIPFIIFDNLRGSVPKDQLIKALVWVILNDRDGTVFTNVKDFKSLNIDVEISEEDIRNRSTIYARKMLARLLDKLPQQQQ